MPVEEGLPENLDRRAVDYQKANANANDALWHARAALDILVSSQPRMMKPDVAVVTAVHMAIYALESHAATLGRVSDSAVQIADEAAARDEP